MIRLSPSQMCASRFAQACGGDEVVLPVLKAPLVASLVGVNRTLGTNNGPVVLNATQSFDPDNTAGLISLYSWSCLNLATRSQCDGVSSQGLFGPVQARRRLARRSGCLSAGFSVKAYAGLPVCCDGIVRACCWIICLPSRPRTSSDCAPINPP